MNGQVTLDENCGNSEENGKEIKKNTNKLNEKCGHLVGFRPGIGYLPVSIGSLWSTAAVDVEAAVNVVFNMSSNALVQSY